MLSRKVGLLFRETIPEGEGKAYVRAHPGMIRRGLRPIPLRPKSDKEYLATLKEYGLHIVILPPVEPQEYPKLILTEEILQSIQHIRFDSGGFKELYSLTPTAKFKKFLPREP